MRYDDGSLERFADGDGDITAEVLIGFVRLALRRLHANEGEKARFLQGLASLLEEHAPNLGQTGTVSRELRDDWTEASMHRQAEDNAHQLGGFLDRFPEAGGIQLDVPRAAMKVG